MFWDGEQIAEQLDHKWKQSKNTAAMAALQKLGIPYREFSTANRLEWSRKVKEMRFNSERKPRARDRDRAAREGRSSRDTRRDSRPE